MFNFKSLPEIMAELDACEKRDNAKHTLALMRDALADRMKNSQSPTVQNMAVLFQGSLGSLMVCSMIKHVPTNGDTRLEELLKVFQDPTLVSDLMTEAAAQQ